ncbi:short-chain dehydrogenase [Subtercola boreus]|uniref:Short-chain dehydrogenase n=2 Tax=Subtercola boreus TaxID=120213 RepID=A0A3E0VF24_9MICO|nr:short-chain dehydrogenase [Subtercola boreus]TQL54537.1 NAD(P)-dependent dehydrogenase (short-subunit alcohol dehydrogenase family) [Subtercola boreus]
MQFDGRVAVITGSGSGLGRAHALLLASRGARIVVNDLSRSADTGESYAQRVVDEIVAAGGVAVADTNSVATPEGGAAIIQQAVDSFGTVDILVNNAGIVRDKSFAKMTAEQVDPVLDVHLGGAFNVTLPAYRLMKEQNHGRIISTTSAAGLFGNFGQANYGAAKMGLIGLSRVIALESAKYDITANIIAPIAATAMSAGILDEEWERRLRPDLVSPVVAYLAHSDCTVSGEIFSVAAGRVARIFIGEGRGFYSPDLTIEDVRDSWSTILSEEGYSVPMSAADERDLLEKSFTAFENPTS